MMTEEERKKAIAKALATVIKHQKKQDAPCALPSDDVAEADLETTLLGEGVVRTGSIGMMAGQAKTSGDKSAQMFAKAARAVGGNHGKSLEDRIGDIELALESIAVGLMEQRKQIGALVGVNVAGHLLAVKARK